MPDMSETPNSFVEEVQAFSVLTALSGAAGAILGTIFDDGHWLKGMAIDAGSVGAVSAVMLVLFDHERMKRGLGRGG